nr:MAG TPA: hypothetical protein [Caudoviricetes sp.]
MRTLLVLASSTRRAGLYKSGISPGELYRLSRTYAVYLR